MSLADDVERARKVDDATIRIATLVGAAGGPAEDVAYALLRDELHRLAVENQKFRDVLADIAIAHPSECDQTPYWARKALCTHEKREKNERGEMACVECWDVEGDS